MSHRNGYPILRKWEKLFQRHVYAVTELRIGCRCNTCSYDHFSRPIWEGRVRIHAQPGVPYCIFFPSVQRSTNLELFPPPKDHNGINPSYQNRNIKSNRIARSCSLLAVVYWQFYMLCHDITCRVQDPRVSLDSRTMSYTLWFENTEKNGRGGGIRGQAKWEPRVTDCGRTLQLFFPVGARKDFGRDVAFPFCGCMCETQSDWSLKRDLAGSASWKNFRRESGSSKSS